MSVGDGGVEVGDTSENGVVEVDEMRTSVMHDHHVRRMDSVLSKPKGIRGQVLSADDELREAGKHWSDVGQCGFNRRALVVDYHDPSVDMVTGKGARQKVQLGLQRWYVVLPFG